MADGGASPAEFTDRVEAVLPPEPTDILGPFQTADLMTDYLPPCASWSTSRPSAAPTCAWCAIRFTAPAATIWLAFCATWAWRSWKSTTRRTPPLPGCIPSPFSLGSMKASRSGRAGLRCPVHQRWRRRPHCRWRLARQLRERSPHHHAAHQAHGRPRRDGPAWCPR